jgi:N-dimethylarginine dimethylaminohydrolase
VRDIFLLPSLPRRESEGSDKANPEKLNEHSFNGNSMTGELMRVLVCPPGNAGWDSARAAAWQDLGFRHAPDFAIAQSQHEVLCRLLSESGAEVLNLPAAEALTLDAAYTHDASLATDYGLVLMNPGKKSRMAEAQTHADCCGALGIPVLGEVAHPGTSEAGDIVWLDTKTLLIGHGYRTNKEGIEQMRNLLAPKNVEVLAAPLPYGPGPSACLHLMSLISLLDENTILVDLPWLAVETVELLNARKFRLVEIDYSERDTLACNVLALGDNRLIAIEENVKTNQRLREAGFDVRTFPGSEISINGGGGPTCLTRPLLRKPV